MALRVLQPGSGNPRPLVVIYLLPQDTSNFRFPENVAVVADTGPEGTFDQRQAYYASSVPPLDQLLSALQQQLGTSFGPVVLAGFSMGGFAVRRLLALGADPDAVVLADATYGSDLVAWTNYAQKALRQERVFVASHSSSVAAPWQNLKAITGFNLPYPSSNTTRVGNAVVHAYSDTNHSDQGTVVMPTVLIPEALELVKSGKSSQSYAWIVLAGAAAGFVGYLLLRRT